MSQLISTRVRNKLVALRGGLKRRLAVEAMSWLVLALVGLVLVSFALDFTLRMDRLQRAFILILCVVGVLMVAWRYLVRPLSASMSMDDLALLVERRHPPLGDRLISAIQFEQQQIDDQLSQAMIHRMAEQANALAVSLDMGTIVERTRMRRIGGAALLAVGALAALWVWQSDLMNLWLARNIAFADIPWPQRTYLEVKGGPDFTVLRGDDLEIHIDASASSVIPTSVNIYARFPSVGWTEDRVEITSNGKAVFVKKFPAVREAFEFYVTGGDDERDRKRPHQVHLQDPPALSDVLFSVDYPAYMQREARTFDASGGALAVPVGSSVTISALATKDIASARLFLDGQELSPLRVHGVDLGQGRELPRKLSGSFSIDLPPAPASQPASGPAVKPRDPARQLRLALVDTDGYTNRHTGQYVLQVLTDQPPSITLRKRGVGINITPNAILPLDVEAKDDCGLALMQIGCRADLAKEQPKPAELKEAALGNDPRNVRLNHALDLKDAKFEPGFTVHVTAMAQDSLPEPLRGPNRSTSSSLDFKIVKPEELMAELVRRQKEIRLEFEQAVAQQASARARTTSAGQSAASAITEETGRMLIESANLQTTVAAQCVKAASLLDAVREEMVNNRLGTPADATQLAEGIVQPLRALATPMAQAVTAINGAAQITQPQALREQTDRLAGIQADFLAKMRVVLERMVKLESRQELAYKLEVIMKTWEEVITNTRAKGEDQMRNVFETPTQPATQPSTQPATRPAKP